MTLLGAGSLRKHPSVFSAHPEFAAIRPLVRPTVQATSVVVPVHDNQRGIDRILSWWCALRDDARTRELIIVDDGSREPIRAQGPRVLLIRSSPRGPAGARNLGWRAASGEWIAFLDSDCVPDAMWPAAFAHKWDGEIAVQGRVRAMGRDWISKYYEAQGVLKPMLWSRERRPLYLITANALVARPALEAVGGFHEAYRLAAGEDVDLGFRLSAIGPLRWCEEASVEHDFEPSLTSFVHRFVRYGRGNWTLAAELPEELKPCFMPRPFLPRAVTPSGLALAALAYSALAVGFYGEGIAQARK